MTSQLSNKPLILVVDDDPVLVEVARSSIEEVGMGVISAFDGESGLSAFSRDHPDLVLLDVSMPGMDGFETCAAIREHPRGHDVPVIIVTGLNDYASMTRAFEVGATDFITKPLAPLVLQNRIRFTLRALEAIGGLRESQRQLAQAQAVARVGSWELNLDTLEFGCSNELLRVLDIPLGEQLDSLDSLFDCFHPDDRYEVESEISAVTSDQSSWTGDHRLRGNAADQTVHISLEFRHGLPGDKGAIFGTVQDITERKKTEAAIRRLAYFDSLTALPNRRLFNEQLDHVVERARANEDSVALLFVDIDRFKRINDTLGHSAGDELLKVVADRITDLVRASDGLGRPGELAIDGSTARLGGDEFTLFLNRLRRPEDAAIVARRVLQALEPPVRLGSEEVTISASIGIAIYPDDSPTPEQLLRHADSAMYHAKREGGAGFQFFSNSMNEAAIRKLNLETGLRRTLESRSLGVAYQPVVDANTFEVTGVEALARWRRANGENISPEEFIPVAEESGLIVALGEQVLRSACQQMRRLGGQSCSLRLAVNVSSCELRRKDFVAQVAAVLAETGFEATQLDLEITESVSLEDGRVIQNLNELDQMGVRLVLDDFGTGYASVSYLRRIPVQCLKIDRSFTRQVPDDLENAAIVSAMIAMASRLGLSVTVEGVETQNEIDFVTAEGANELQGFHLSRPLEPEALIEFIDRWPSSHQVRAHQLKTRSLFARSARAG